MRTLTILIRFFLLFNEAGGDIDNRGNKMYYCEKMRPFLRPRNPSSAPPPPGLMTDYSRHSTRTSTLGRLPNPECGTPPSQIE